MYRECKNFSKRCDLRNWQKPYERVDGCIICDMIPLIYLNASLVNVENNHMFGLVDIFAGTTREVEFYIQT